MTFTPKEKDDARRRAQRAVKLGKIIKTACVVCGDEKVEMHHEDYARPLDVKCLCSSCHAKERRGETRLLDPDNAHFASTAFRIWQFAEPLGWDCTTPEIADAINENARWVGRVIARKGWSNRVRARRFSSWGASGCRIGMAGIEALDSLNHRYDIDRLIKSATT